MSQPSTQPAPEALNRLPSSYSDVPKLGPALPGDLGRPVLEREGTPADLDTAAQQERAGQAEATERERQLSEIRAARQSAVLFQNRAGRAALVSTTQAAPDRLPAEDLSAAPAGVGARSLSSDPDRDPNAQEQKATFVVRLDERGDVNLHRLVPPASPYLLSAGSVIPASLITGLRSDLPGVVTAQVTERVYDSATGQVLLIPQGARLIGTYDSVVASGQRRALIVWQRIVMPDGSSLKIDNVPATDAAGYAGLEDKVDSRTWSLLKGIALSTLLGVGSELALSGDSDLVRAVRLSTQDSGSRAGGQITSRNLKSQPTITIRAGARVRLVVHRDLVLPPWKE